MKKPPYMTKQAELVSELLITHARHSIKGCHCGWSELGQSHADHVARALDEAGLLVKMVAGLETHILVAESHDGFGLQMTANEKAIDKLRELLIPNREVKYLAIYKFYPVEKIKSYNYTQLKELRGGK